MSSVQQGRRLKLTKSINPSHEGDAGAQRAVKFLKKAEEYRESVDFGYDASTKTIRFEYTEAEEAFEALGISSAPDLFAEDDHQNNQVYWVNRGVSRDPRRSL
jgi:hypothetical protein